MSELLSNTIVQAALVSAASHVVVWFVKLLPQLPGGYSSAKRAVAVQLLKMVTDAPTAPVAAPVPVVATSETTTVAPGTNTALTRGL